MPVRITPAPLPLDVQVLRSRKDGQYPKEKALFAVNSRKEMVQRKLLHTEQTANLSTEKPVLVTEKCHCFIIIIQKGDFQISVMIHL